MKTGKSLTELAMQLDRQQKNKRDYVADTRKLEIVTENDNKPELQMDLEDGMAVVMPITEHAHTQLANRIKVPMKYYDRMRVEAPDLLATNVNHWFNAVPEQRMVRTLDGKARAFLSNRYRPLDNFDLAQTVLPKIQEMECSVMSCEVTEKRMYLKCVTERITSSIVGDIVQAGLVISNSEIGSGSLRVEPLIYTLVCKNGMIAADSSMRKYHVGRNGNNEDGVYEFLRDETRRADDRAFWLKVQDVVGAALNQVTFEKIVRKAATTNDIEIPNPQKTIEVMSKQYGLNEAEQGGIMQHLIKGGNLSGYGLMNAVTRTSQDVVDYDRATELERLGGQIIELKPNEWKVLTADAA